ncbi:MAG: class I SAM-dependent methyltransferase [Betaproteobacteria bacterium]
MSPQAYATIRACPICGGHEAVALHGQCFVLPEGSPLPSAYTVASCEICGTCFADTSAPQRAYDLHYRQFSRYDDRSFGTGGGTSELDRERLAETAALIAQQSLPRGIASRVLDIGCAGGGLLLALRDCGFENLAGMDPSPACVERVRRHGFACRQGMFSDIHQAPPEEATCDVVILSHVVEHLVDVRKAMLAVRNLLDQDGVCYVEVPDASRYVADKFVPFYFFDSEHINHFDRATLHNLARVTGFDVLCDGERDLRVDGDNLYPAAWALLRKSATIRKPAPETALRTALAAYVESSPNALDWSGLDDLAERGCPVLLWGAGSHAQRLLQASPLARCNLVGVVDRDPGKQGLALLGHSIHAPEDVLEDLDPDVTIVIASVLHGDQIAASIAGSGLLNPLVVAR